jgi:hypothetical protein
VPCLDKMMAALEVLYLSYGIGTLKMLPLASATLLARHTTGRAKTMPSSMIIAMGMPSKSRGQGEEIPFIAPNTPYSGNYPEDLSHQEIRQTTISNSPEGPHNDVDTYGGARTKDYQTPFQGQRALTVHLATAIQTTCEPESA